MTLPPRSLVALASDLRFSGVVRADRAGEMLFAAAFGEADRRHAIANTVDTRFALASGGKGFTAVTVLSLIHDGVLGLDTRARGILGADLPLVDDAVSVEHLLAHRSGIGDYVDEEIEADIDDYLLPISMHRLDRTEAYLAVLDGFPQKFTPGTRFSYCNSGYVILALLAERVTGRPFEDLVQERVCRPAGLADTGFLRSDALPGRAAVGYLTDGVRTNVFHLPVLGSGDGGIYSTVADLAAFWPALIAGRIVPAKIVQDLVQPRSDVPAEGLRYGRGVWLAPSGRGLELHGYDAGVSFRSVHDPDSGLTHTTISNTSEGAWPIARHLAELLG